MATDLQFLQEVTAFLEEKALYTPRKSCGDSLEHDGSTHNWIHISPVSSLHDDSLLLSSFEVESYLNCTSEGEIPQNKKTKASSGADRLQKHRQKVKTERDELHRAVNELSKQLGELIAVEQGTKTTARTDLVLSNTFWRKTARNQREQRYRSEAEHKRLLGIVNSQGVYINSMRLVLQEHANTINTLPTDDGLYDRIDDLKWLRLKSSDETLYEVYRQEVNDCYALVDKVLDECDVDLMPVGAVSSIRRKNLDGDIYYAQYVNKFVYEFDFEGTCNAMWKVSLLPHRQLDREVYEEDLSEAGNTVAFKFRVIKTLANGSTVSVRKRALSKRFRDRNQVVIVWKIFSEGEGLFSGMDASETIWVRIRPFFDGVNTKVLKEACSRQTPVQHIRTKVKDTYVKEFRAMMQDTAVEDAGECARLLGELLRNGGSPNVDLCP